MQTVWYVLVALMITAYVVLDGFDLGAGAIYLLAGLQEAERREILGAIGPVWDGNEVWLIAGGGTLFFAFPAVYASSFSGFYLSIHMVAWLLIARAIAIEFREKTTLPVWRQFFDWGFAFGSMLLIVFFGVAVGNVIRGVPLHPDGNFFEPLWTNFRPGIDTGILDWYTVLCAMLAFTALVLHGASYLALKTEAALQRRARFVAALGIAPLFLLSLLALIATIRIRPQVLENYQRHPASFAIPACVLLTFMAMIYFSLRFDDLRRFLSSCAYIVLMLLGAAYALYPSLLPATTGDAYSLTIHNSSAGYYSLSKGIYWWSAGIAIAIGYFVILYRMFRGKATSQAYE